MLLWGNAGGGISLSKREEALSGLLMQAWGRFANAGDPGGDGLRWPRYTTEGDQLMTLDLISKSEAGLKQVECDFWDTLEPGSRSERRF